MAFEIQKLKYAQNGLEPYISKDTLHYHYGKHTKAYFHKTNELVKGTTYAKCDTLEDLLRRKTLKKDSALFHDAAQAWNHTFYWNCLTPKQEQGKPSPELLEAIEKRFESFDSFQEQFNEAAKKQFGSGWAWLYLHTNKLVIETTSNADTPIVDESKTPLLVVDIWEHAYYLDQQNDRGRYLDKIWNVINWNFVNGQYARATSGINS